MNEAESNGNLNLINKYILSDITNNDTLEDETENDFNDEIINTDFNKYLNKHNINENEIILSSNTFIEENENKNKTKNPYTLKKSDIKILKKVSINLMRYLD